MRFQFVDQHRDEYPVARMCRELDVSRSGYYAWRKREPSKRSLEDQRLTVHIKAIFAASHRTYGSPRIHAELKAQGIPCGRNRAARLMRKEGLLAIQTKPRRVRTTNSNHKYPIAPNLLDRQFTADAPRKKWVADITYIRTGEGWLFLAVIEDLFSRRIVGWAMDSTLESTLVERALEMALTAGPCSPGLLHHSDRGSQYADHGYREIMETNGIVVSMSRTGNCYDNAAMESFFSSLKREWVNHRSYATRAEAKTDVFYYIELFYNRKRLHSTLGYMSPVQFEQQYRQTVS